MTKSITQTIAFKDATVRDLCSVDMTGKKQAGAFFP